MSNPEPSLFHRAIGHALSSWTALQTCVANCSGGRNSREIADWLVGATEQWMTENDGIEPDELADFYQDVLWTDFNTIVEDGSIGLVCQTICGYQTALSRGESSKVEAAIRETPTVAMNVRFQADDDDEDDPGPGVSFDRPDSGRLDIGRNDSGREDIGSRGPGTLDTDSAQTSASPDAGTEEMEVAEEEQEEGWTTVPSKKGGKKK